MEKLLQTLRERQELLIGLAFGAAIGWVISTAPGWAQASSYKDWWDIATAFGTVGAVIAAVFFALRDGLRMRREQVIRARLAATAVETKLLKATFVLDAFIKCMSAHPENYVESNYRESVRDDVELSRQAISGEEIQALAAAPGETALTLMSGIGELEFLSFGLGMEGRADMNPDRFVDSAKRALDMLSSVMKTCSEQGNWR